MQQQAAQSDENDGAHRVQPRFADVAGKPGSSEHPRGKTAEADQCEAHHSALHGFARRRHVQKRVCALDTIEGALWIAAEHDGIAM